MVMLIRLMNKVIAKRCGLYPGHHRDHGACLTSGRVERLGG